MSLPEIDFESFIAGTRAQLNLNRLKNRDKDETRSQLQIWGLILGRPFGNLMAAIED